MTLLERTLKSIEHARHNAPILGWSWILKEKYLRRRGVKEVQFQVSGLEHPIWCRVVSSDIYEFTHLLGRGKTVFNFPIVPEYIVDAGSNAGFSVLRFRADYPKAKIIAVEPEPSNIAQLEKNCLQYPWIIIERAALWSHATTIRIKSYDTSHNAFQVEQDDGSAIRALSVMDIVEQNELPRIDLLKIDIEGSEKILFGHPNVGEWLPLVRILMIETHDRFETGCTDAVESATIKNFDYQGMVGEYRLYFSRNLN
jgi:FkbM family methyltransferase